jgi:hypothetical protein
MVARGASGAHQRKWAFLMRTVVVGLAAVLCLCLANAAQAERRMFIIGADTSGYGVDRCLAAGAECGAAAANSYCKGHHFAQAASFRKVDRDDVTGAIPAGGACGGSRCDNLVAILCTR